jgi:hypothetical protein
MGSSSRASYQLVANYSISHYKAGEGGRGVHSLEMCTAEIERECRLPIPISGRKDGTPYSAYLCTKKFRVALVCYRWIVTVE